MNNLIIFDLDGVITSEEAYWDTAGLTLHELLYSPHYWGLDRSELSMDGQYHAASTAQESRSISRAVFSESEILSLKARSINSNWDTCYVVVCLNLIDLLRLLPDCSSLLPLEPWDEGWIGRFRDFVPLGLPQGSPRHLTRPAPLQKYRVYSPIGSVFENTVFRNAVGLELINRFDAYASEILGFPIEGVFSRHSPFWAFCRNIFQEWYLGDVLYMETYMHAPIQLGKPGCIHYEKPLLPLEQIRFTLETLRNLGYVMGFATGRVYQEAVYPLKMYELLAYFDEQHVSTYDDVEREEAVLRSQGDHTLLSKPNPFPFLIAVKRKLDDKQLLSDGFIVVGDSPSDILGGRAAGAISIAVMTGALTPEARTLLAQSSPDFTIADLTRLPDVLENIDSLATIQHLQFTEREKAERLLQHWFVRHMHLKTESITLTPKAVSLNSFNGFYRNNGEEYFFKTHVEEQGILEEYYHAEQLRLAGYNIVSPLQTIHEGGQQMVIYPVVHWPVMFDLMREVELENAEESIFEKLVSAEKRECSHMLNIYESTLSNSSAEEHGRAPIHQLFWYRITGGRLKSFYDGKLVRYPEGKYAQEESISFNELLSYRWVINGILMRKTLGELIERVRVVLHPCQDALTIIGHGDAHFGNVFLEDQSRFLYFDPAFAGRHSPLLDMIKPLFHNVFAMWMYFPSDIVKDLHLTISRRDMTITIEHNFTLTPVREAILQTKVEHLLRPLIAKLRARNALPANWKEIIQLALMCCPLLTINLLDGARMPPSISWLGLLLAVQTGNDGIQPWGYDL